LLCERSIDYAVKLQPTKQATQQRPIDGDGGVVVGNDSDGVG